MCKKPQNGNAVVERNDHDAPSRQFGAVCAVGRCGASQEAAAMDPNHDGAALGTAAGAGPYVDEETVFGANTWALHHAAAHSSAFGTIGRGITHSAPRTRGRR